MNGPYIRISGVLEVEVSALTGAGSIGNYNMHATARILFSGGVYEVPVMTGNALKHWHAYYLAQVYQVLGGSQLNDFCKKGVGLRGYTVNSTLNKPNPASSEENAIADVCNDIHGFLVPGQQIKRDSLVKFSFAIPVLDDANLQTALKFAVTHNRVDPRPPAEEMMVFKQEYSSALYGFSASLDLAYVCEPMYSSGQSPCDLNEKKLRIKSTVLAFIPLLAGSGSKQARALPIIKVKDILAVLANIPIPNLINGACPDYMSKSVQSLLNYCEALGVCKKHSSSTGEHMSKRTTKGEVEARVQIYCYSERGLCKALESVKYEGVEFKFYDNFAGLIKDVAETAIRITTGHQEAGISE